MFACVCVCVRRCCVKKWVRFKVMLFELFSRPRSVCEEQVEVPQIARGDFNAYLTAQCNMPRNRVPPSNHGFDSIYVTNSRIITHVDNSRYIPLTMDNTDVLSCSSVLIRPRRSGKTTFGLLWLEYCRGNKALFERQELARDSVAMNRMPKQGELVCVHLDISKVTDVAIFAEQLASSLNVAIVDFGEEELELRGGVGIVMDRFEAFLRKHNAKAAFFIDEYDSVVRIASPAELRQAQKCLQDLFVSLKASAKFVPIVFVTGSSRVQLANFWSGANNMSDKSFDSRFATVLGYSWPDIERLYPVQLTMLEQLHGLSRNELRSELTRWYDNYRFSEDSKDSVFSVWSINRFIETGKFLPHLANTATSSSTVKEVQHISVPELTSICANGYRAPCTIKEILKWRFGSKNSKMTFLDAALMTLSGGFNNEPLGLVVPNEDAREAIGD